MSTEQPLPTLTEYLGGLRAEIDEYSTMLKDLDPEDIKDNIKIVLSIHARIVEIRTQVVRSKEDKLMKFRTQEIDPFLTALNFQYTGWSRLGTFMENEWKMAKGAL